MPLKYLDVNVKDGDGQTPMHYATRYAPRGTALNAETVMFVPRGPSLLNLKEDEDEVDNMEGNEEVNLLFCYIRLDCLLHAFGYYWFY